MFYFHHTDRNHSIKSHTVTLNSLEKRMLIYVLDFFDRGAEAPKAPPWICHWHINFFWKNTLDNCLSLLTFVNCWSRVISFKKCMINDQEARYKKAISWNQWTMKIMSWFGRYRSKSHEYYGRMCWSVTVDQ